MRMMLAKQALGNTSEADQSTFPDLHHLGVG